MDDKSREFLDATGGDAREAQTEPPQTEERAAFEAPDLIGDFEREHRDYMEGCGHLSRVNSARNALRAALSQPVREPMSEGRASDRQLMDFYSVDTLPDLIDAQACHIERLQAKLPQLDQPAFTRVREG